MRTHLAGLHHPLLQQQAVYVGKHGLQVAQHRCWSERHGTAPPLAACGWEAGAVSAAGPPPGRPERLLPHHGEAVAGRHLWGRVQRVVDEGWGADSQGGVAVKVEVPPLMPHGACCLATGAACTHHQAACSAQTQGARSVTLIRQALN